MTLALADMTMETTGTPGAGAIILDGAVAGWNSFASQMAVGDQTFYCQRQTGGAWEVCKGTLIAANQLTKDVVLDSSDNGTVINWSGGTRSVFCCLPASQVLLKDNALSEIGAFMVGSNNLAEITSAPAARTSLGLGAAALLAVPIPLLSGGTGATTAAGARTALGLGSVATLNAGTAASNVPQLDGSARLPAVDGSQLLNLPSSGNTLSGQSGGTAGKVIRLSGADTWTDAAQSDTADQLEVLALKVGTNYYPPGRQVPGMSALTAGTSYWLGTSGNMTSVPPAPGPSVRSVYLGKALDTTTFLFVPQRPISG